MCLIAIAWQVDPRFPLVVAANRDEWRERPTEGAHWWKDHPQILAGRDLRAGGTWMGVTKGGRFAAVTNFRDPSDRRSTALSRGTLVTEYLLDDKPPEEFLARLSPKASLFNGFNLVVGDRERLCYFGSREPSPRAIEPGIHGLSNHLLDEPWPKVVRGRQAMQAALKGEDPAAQLFDMLSDREGAADAELPDTGVGIDWERRLAPPLIIGDDYGTRASTVLAISKGGSVNFEERARGAAGQVEGVSQFSFRVS
jgi:uncharacterized protein with NRDE domain